MKEDYWSVFKENGDALCYLLYRAGEKETERQKLSSTDTQEREQTCSG